MGPDGRYYQIGITSFGADLLEGVIDQEKYPGTFLKGNFPVCTPMQR